MGSFGNLLILVTYIVEVSLLIYLEVKTWKTLYTPFSFLVLPYTVVLLISISVAGNFNFVEFYYPSILIWCGGMLLFAIPSLTLGALLAFYGKPVNGQVDKGSFPKSILFFIGLVILLFIYHFRQILGGTTFFVGSDDFANDFSGYGFWAHLRLISLPILIMAIYYLDKKHWWLCLVVVPVLLINFLNQVKGWVIIPVISGLALRLYSGKMKLNLLFLCYTTLGAFFVFLVSYMFLPVLGNDSVITSDLFELVYERFIHYFTSGVLGLSYDMAHGFPDKGDFDILIAPFVNLFNQILGDKEILSPVNPLFFHTGISYTNVRTFFGTIYIYSGESGFVLYVLFASIMMYVLKLCTLVFNNVYIYVIYFFECGLLGMGWFEFYFFHLAMIEVPILTLFLMVLDKFFSMRERTNKVGDYGVAEKHSV